MATRVEYNNIAKILEQRILERIKRYQPSDPKLREGLTRIGIMIEREAKQNIMRKRIVDTGSLLNSIRFKLFQRGDISGVEVGSYSIPYAAVHEFGFNGPVSIRSHQRLISQAFGRPIQAKKINVTAHQRMVQIRARPYLRPAVQSVRKDILEIIRGLNSGD